MSRKDHDPNPEDVPASASTTANEDKGEPPQFPDVASSPSKPRAKELATAHVLLRYGVASTNSLAKLYDLVMWSRGRGAPTHEDQGLLRAMLVMAGATLDVVVKRIIRDALQLLVNRSKNALETAAKHVYRRLLKNIQESGGQRLAQALLSRSPVAALVELIIDDITGESLQSMEQVRQAAAYLGLEDFSVPQGVQEAFAARNQIVHEMDIVHEQRKGRGRRRRQQRKKDEMRAFAEVLLRTAIQFCKSVDDALTDSHSHGRA